MKYITEVDILMADRVPYSEWPVDIPPGTCLYHAPTLEGGPALYIRYESLKDYKIATDAHLTVRSGIISSHEGVKCHEDCHAVSIFLATFGLMRVRVTREPNPVACAICRYEITSGYAYVPKFLRGNFFRESYRVMAHLECLAVNLEALPVHGHQIYLDIKKYPKIVIRSHTSNGVEDYHVWFHSHYGLTFYKIQGPHNYEPEVELDGRFSYREAWDAFRQAYPAFPKFPFDKTGETEIQWRSDEKRSAS